GYMYQAFHIYMLDPEALFRPYWVLVTHSVVHHPRTFRFGLELGSGAEFRGVVRSRLWLFLERLLYYNTHFCKGSVVVVSWNLWFCISNVGLCLALWFIF